MSDTTSSIFNILSQHRPITKNKSDLVHDNDVSGLAGPFNLSKKQQQANISEGNTTAQTFDDSFTEVTHKKKSQSRRENKQMDKERMQEERLTKKLNTNSAASSEMAFKAPRVKQPSRTSEDDEITENDNNTFTAEEEENDDENSTSFENTNNLTKKKQQYLQQGIVDRSGAYDYANDPSNYKKARKRLQNRESAVRSRMKKRQEMEVLEEEVRQLQEQKAAVESANDELKRQNKYWEDLFAKQQLQSVVPVKVAVSSPTLPHQHSVSTNSNGFNSQSEFTDPSAASEIGAGVSEESSYEPSFTQLKMASDKTNKRQKRQADSSFELSEMMFSHELDEQLEEATFERIEPRNTNQAQSDSMQRQISLDNFDRVNTLNIDEDCFLIRRPNDEHRRDLRFFGLALVFGAVGAVTSMGSSQTDVNIGGQVAFNSAQSLKSSDRLTTSESKPIKDGDDFEELTQFEVDPSSTSQNLFTALRLVLQALKTVPVFTYISFALSLLFLVMYLNPLGALFSSQKSEEAILQRVHRRRRSSRDAPQQQSTGMSSSDRRQRQSSQTSSSGKRRSSNK